MLKVLMVDDEKAICEGVCMLVEWGKYGFYIPEYVLNGVEALEKMKSVHYDLVITDIKMPGLSGLELVEKMVKEGYSSKVIILSGYKDFDYAKKAIEFNVKNYLLKPVDEDILVNMLLSLKNEIENEKRKENVVIHGTRVIQEKVLSDFVKSKVNPDMAGSLLEKSNISLGGKGFTVCIVYSEEPEICSGSPVKSYPQPHIKEIVDELLEENKAGYSFIENDLTVVIFIRNLYESRYFTNSLSSRLTSIYEKGFTLGVGCEKLQWGDIPRSYEEACIALEWRFYLDGSTIIRFDDIYKQRNYSIGAFKWDYENLLTYLRNMNEKKAALEIQKLHQEFLSNTLPVKTVIIILMNVFLKLSRLVYEEGGISEEVLGNDCSLEKLQSIQNIRQVDVFLTDCCKKIISFLEAKSLKSSNSTIEAIKNYVKENCTEDITIKSTAEVFFLNSAYLGRLFHNKTGLCFIDYLNDCRIAFSVRLLEKGSNIKLLDLCYQSGYKDISYFYSQFKKRMGMTPSEYKKSM